jgi:hypothetical protein
MIDEAPRSPLLKASIKVHKKHRISKRKRIIQTGLLDSFGSSILSCQGSIS